jgi:phage terminase large subunit
VFQAIKDVCSSMGILNLTLVNEHLLNFKFSNGAEIKCTDFENMHNYMHQATSIWIEEFSEFTLDELTNVLDDFVRFGYKGNEYYKQTVLTFNPYGKYNTLDDICNIKGKENTFVHHSSYKDNKYLSQEMIDTIEKRFAVDTDTYKPIYLGRF